MKLLFFDQRIPFLLENRGEPIGGASTRVFHLITELSRQGHRTGILTWIGANSKVKEHPGFDIVESYRFLDLIPHSRSKIKGYDFIYDRFLMYKAVKAYNPDFMFQICSALNTGVLAWIANRLSIPFVFLAASNADADGGYENILNKISQYSYQYGLRNARLIICQNSYQYNLFRRKFKKEKLLLMPNPFRYQGSLPSPRPYKDRKYVAWLGNFSPVKNLPILSSIAKALPQVKFKIAGSLMRTTNQEILSALKDLETYKNVELVGRLTRNQVFPFLSNAYLLLNTSFLEGFSNTFLESFAVGTSVVTRNCIDPDQIINTHRIGATMENYEDLTEAIATAISDPNFDDMVVRCVNYVSQFHDVTSICEKLVEKLKYLQNSNN